VTESKDEEIKQLVVQSKSKRTNEETTTTRTTQAPHDDKTMIKKIEKLKNDMHSLEEKTKQENLENLIHWGGHAILMSTVVVLSYAYIKNRRIYKE